MTYASAVTSQVSLISNDTLMSFTEGGTYRWMSPELLDPDRFGMPQSEENRPTKLSDCYALGMVIYEVGVVSADLLFYAVNRVCARFYADTAHTLKLSRISLSSMRSLRGIGRRSRMGRHASVSTTSCGESSSYAGWKIATHDLA